MNITNYFYYTLLAILFLPFCHAFAEQEQLACITVSGQGDGGWLPTSSDIKNLQDLLPEKFENASKSLSKYQTQLSGMPKLANYTIRCTGSTGTSGELKNVKLIYVDGFCREAKFTRESIEKGVTVNDGGSCFFSGSFDPIRKEFLSFYFNGVA